MLEGSTKTCPHCEGRGIVRSVSSCALSVLRSIEEQLITKRPENLTVQCHRDVASYILNEKRDRLLTLEQSFNVSIFIVPSDSLKSAEVLIERGGERAPTLRKALTAPVKMETALAETGEAEEDEQAAVEDIPEEGSEAEEERASESRSEGEEQRRGRRRRRRGRRGGRRGREEEFASQPPQPDSGNGHPPVGLSAADAQDIDLSKAEQPWVQADRPHRDFDVEPAIQNGTSERRQEETKEHASNEAGEAPSSDSTGEAKESGDKTEAENAARRWAPPQPTVDRSSVQRKGGWWQRRSEP